MKVAVAKTKPRILDRVIGLIENLTRWLSESTDFSNTRLSAIEDRLSLLDQGDDAAAARRAALSRANTARVAAFREPLSMTLSDDDAAEIRWTR